jgi:diketogulonate reductase-like aldo/keto reductase
MGLGTGGMRGGAGLASVVEALGNGYRLLDSAVNYENEGMVGHAVRASGVPRDEVIVTSKLPGRHHGRALPAVEESVFRTGLDAVDLYLIHWPNPITGRYVEAWAALVEAKARGLVRHIGVSNFLPEHVDRIVAETGVVPVVNQIEVHPYFPQEETVAYHRAHGILVEAWSPLGQGGALLDEPVVAAVAAAHGTTPAGAVLAWHIARGVIPLPKSTSGTRQRDNLGAFSVELTAEEVARLTALGRPDGRLAGLDPAVYEEF